MSIHTRRWARRRSLGPVLSVIRWSDEKQAIDIANRVRYGFTGIVFTNDIKRAGRVARQMEAGLVGINGSGAQFIGLPVGGSKSSGIGKERSPDGSTARTGRRTPGHPAAHQPAQAPPVPKHFRRQPRLPQRRTIANRTEHDGLDPFQHKGSRPSSARRPEDPRSAARVFQVEVARPSGPPAACSTCSWRVPASP
jgi:hypothetical protein